MRIQEPNYDPAIMPVEEEDKASTASSDESCSLLEMWSFFQHSFESLTYTEEPESSLHFTSLYPPRVRSVSESNRQDLVKYLQEEVRRRDLYKHAASSDSLTITSAPPQAFSDDRSVSKSPPPQSPTCASHFPHEESSQYECRPLATAIHSHLLSDDIRRRVVIVRGKRAKLTAFHLDDDDDDDMLNDDSWF